MNTGFDERLSRDEDEEAIEEFVDDEEDGGGLLNEEPFCTVVVFGAFSKNFCKSSI